MRLSSGNPTESHVPGRVFVLAAYDDVPSQTFRNKIPLDGVDARRRVWMLRSDFSINRDHPNPPPNPNPKSYVRMFSADDVIYVFVAETGALALSFSL